MTSSIQVTVVGLDKLQANLNRFAGEIQSLMEGAAKEISSEIVDSPGLRTYPPTTAANLPPTPYYERGQGMQYKYGNNGKSKNYGRMFTDKAYGNTITIGNDAPYAIWLSDKDSQASHMAAIGWRKLYDVAVEKTERITRIIQGWIDRTITRVGL